MLTRTLSAALIALLLATPLAAAWCEACIQDRCDMSMADHDMTMDGQDAAHDVTMTHDAAMTSHHDETESDAPPSHCAEMASSDRDHSDRGNSDKALSTETATESTAPFSTQAECCVEADSNDVQLALIPTGPYVTHLDLAPTANGTIDIAISASQGPADVEWTPRPPPRPLFTLHSLLLI